jgi:(p)ppGpp synthase/HD superfamily hydrolase
MLLLSVSATCRAPLLASARLQSSYNEERDSKKSKTDTAGYPGLTEMIAIKRMLIYLKCGSSDVLVRSLLHNVVEDSEKRHTKGQAKYKHLPVRFLNVSHRASRW